DLTDQEIEQVDLLLVNALKEGKSESPMLAYASFLGKVSHDFTLVGAVPGNLVVSAFDCAGALMNAGTSCRSHGCDGAAATFCAAMTQLSSAVTQILDAVNQSIGLSVKPIVNMVSVTFDANGGTGNMAIQSMLPNTTTTLNMNLFTHSGTSPFIGFAGWAITPDGPVVYNDAQKISTGINLKLYAVWRPGVRIVYDSDGSVGIMASQVVVNNTTAVLKPNTFSKLDAFFAGWSLTSHGPVAYVDGSRITVESSDVTLYPVWQERLLNYLSTSVSFDGFSSYVKLPNCLLDGNSNNFTISIRFQTSQKGGVLLGDQAGIVSSNVINSVPILYVDPNGYLSANMLDDGGHSVSILSQGSAVADGKWHTAQLTIAYQTMSLTLDGTLIGTKLTTGFGLPRMINSQIGTGVVLNQWSYFQGSISDFSVYVVQPAVIYNANGGAGSMPSQVGLQKQSLTLNPNTFTKPGYVFAGWSLSAKGSAVYADTQSITLGTRSVTLYAVWQVANIEYDFTQASSDSVLTSGNNISYSAQNGALFDGSSSYIGLPSSLLYDNNKNFTISMTFRTRYSGGVLLGYQYALPGSQTAGEYVPMLYVDNSGLLRALMWHDDKKGHYGDTSIVSMIGVADDRWHTVQFTVSTDPSTNNSFLELYLDAQLVGTNSSNSLWPCNLINNQIGTGFGNSGYRNLDDGWDYFNGYIQNFSLYTL
ncbi:MAG: InlB B-repeat-containing protein, partial [Myxococcaceae bacterium]